MRWGDYVEWRDRQVYNPPTDSARDWAERQVERERLAEAQR